MRKLPFSYFDDRLAQPKLGQRPMVIGCDRAAKYRLKDPLSSFIGSPYSKAYYSLCKALSYIRRYPLGCNTEIFCKLNTAKPLYYAY